MRDERSRATKRQFGAVKQLLRLPESGAHIPPQNQIGVGIAYDQDICLHADIIGDGVDWRSQCA